MEKDIQKEQNVTTPRHCHGSVFLSVLLPFSATISIFFYQPTAVCSKNVLLGRKKMGLNSSRFTISSSWGPRMYMMLQ